MTKVLIAEDDALIALTLEMGLVSDGYEVCGVAPTIAKGVELAELHRPDFAVIDLHLAHGDDGRVLAEKLTRLGPIGIVFATGLLDPDRLAGGPRGGSLQKPYRPRDVVEALRAVEYMQRSGVPPEELPLGLQLVF